MSEQRVPRLSPPYLGFENGRLDMTFGHTSRSEILGPAQRPDCSKSTIFSAEQHLRTYFALTITRLMLGSAPGSAKASGSPGRLCAPEGHSLVREYGEARAEPALTSSEWQPTGKRKVTSAGLTLSERINGYIRYEGNNGRTVSVSGELAVDRELLRRFSLLQQLSPQGFNELARTFSLSDVAVGGQLFSLGSTDQWAFCLLEGTIELADRRGVTRTVSAGSDESQQLLGLERPRPVTATVKEKARLVRLNSSLLQILSSAVRNDSYSVTEIHADDQAPDSRLLYQICQDYQTDKLRVPSLPEVALRVRKAVDDPDLGPKAVAKIVQADPPLAAHLVRAARSALFPGKQSVESISAAVVRLGLSTTRELVLGYKLRELFKGRHPLLKQRMQAVWHHSSVVAAVSFVLARLTPGIAPEQALLAGLLHDVGVMVTISQAEAHSALFSAAGELDVAIAKLRAQVGAMVLRKWEFADDMITAALEAEVWDRDPAPKPDLCDLVLLAHLHERPNNASASARPANESIPARGKVTAGGLTPELQHQVLLDAKVELSELHRLLGGAGR